MPSKTVGISMTVGYCIASLVFLGCSLLPLISCGGGGHGSSGSGSVDYDYGVSLSPDKTMVAPGSTVNLNMHYDAPANNAGITWKLTCAQTDCGSVSSAGIYTAPAKVDAQIVVGIRATSNDKPTQGYYVEVWVTGKIVVQVTPNTSPMVMQVDKTAQFTATVNSPDTAVVWQVNGTTGGNSTIGTVSTSGLYTAPASVPNPDTVTLTVVAHVDSTASTSIQIQIMPVPRVSVSISPRDKSVATGATLQFTATVQNTTDTAVQWQVNGIQGGNSTLGTISSAGLFTAPAAVPSPAKETITAVSHADSTKSDSTSVTIVALHNSLLNGSYSFELSGPDANGKMTAAIGSLIADGNGNIHGLMDINGVASSAAQKAQQVAGTYTIGAQNVGRMYLNFSPALTLSFAVNNTGNDAKLIEFDTTGTRYVGSLQKQESGLSWSKFVGDYVYSCYGTTVSGEWMTAIGRFHATAGGSITNASVYSKEQGSTMKSLSNLTGSFTMSDNTYGRGDFSLMQSGTAAHFSYYMTSGGDLYFLSTDPVPADNPLLVGRILSQASGPFSYGSLSGASVFSLAGVVASDSSKSIALAGKWQAIASSNSLSGGYDLNEGGQISATQFSGTYSIDVTGYGYLSSNEFLYKSLIFYIVDQNKAILMQSGGNEGLIGMAEPQQASTCDNTLFNGTYRIGPVSMPRPSGSISQGYLVADGHGTVAGAEEVLDQGIVDETFSGNYSIDSTCRVLVTVTNPETFHYVAYPVSGTRFLGISIEPNDSKPNLASLDQ